MAPMPSTVAIVRCPTYAPAAVDQALEEALTLLGGITQFIKRDEQVLLKPNLLAAATPDEQATTHPEIVAGVIRQVVRAGGRPFIAESPAFGSLAHVAETAGIGAVARAHQVPLVELNHPIHLPLKNPLSSRWLVGDPRVVQADVLVNLPKLKAHVQTRLTGAIKNLYGCVPGKRKVWWHFQAQHDVARFSEMLADNARAVQSALTIVDAVIAMEGQGPRRGTPKLVGLIVAGADPVAVDTVLCELVGLPVQQYEVVQAAARRGVGIGELAAIRLVGEPLERVRLRDFQIPGTLQDISFNVPRMAKSALRQGWLRLVQERMAPYGR